MIKKLIIVLILIFLSGCGIIPEPPEQNRPVYRAYLVGVGDYLFYGPDVDLNSPAPNTEKLKSIFVKCKFGKEETEFIVIDTLIDWNATKENILNGILEVFGEAEENDVSYFYYMGHGGVNNGIPVITPTETKFTLETEITVHELEEHLSMIPGTKVVFLETCHSGNFIDKNVGERDFNDLVIEIFDQNSIDLINKEGYQILTCGTGEQYCWECGSSSYFCNGLYEGCLYLKADINEDGIVNLYEAYLYIGEWVSEHSSHNQDVQMYPDGSTFPIVEY